MLKWDGVNVSLAFCILSKNMFGYCRKTFHVFLWSDDKEIVGIVNTSRGDRLLVTAAPPKIILAKMADRHYVKDNLMSVSKNFDDKWRICLWILGIIRNRNTLNRVENTYAKL